MEPRSCRANAHFVTRLVQGIGIALQVCQRAVPLLQWFGACVVVCHFPKVARRLRIAVLELEC